MPLTKRITKVGLSAGMSAVIFVAALGACSQDSDPTDKPKAASPPVKVIAQPIKMETDSVVVKAIGTARARRSAVIYPDTGGEVTAVRFAAGDRVFADQVLLELDAREEQLAIQRAAVALRDGKQLLRRYERIKVPGAISASQVDAGRIAVESADLQKQQAELAMEKRTVRAPFAGHVGLTNIDPGARINAQTEITRLDDRSELYVDFAAPEEAFRQIKANERLTVRPFAYPDETLEARVLTTDSSLNATSRSLTVRTVIDNRDDRLRPGMSFRVEFTVPGQQFPAVPEAAIVWGGDGAYLWAVRDGKAQRVSLSIIARKDGQVLVRAPLTADSLVIAEGVHKVREGAEVTAVNLDNGAGEKAGGSNDNVKVKPRDSAREQPAVQPLNPSTGSGRTGRSEIQLTAENSKDSSSSAVNGAAR